MNYDQIQTKNGRVMEKSLCKKKQKRAQGNANKNGYVKSRVSEVKSLKIHVFTRS